MPPIHPERWKMQCVFRPHGLPRSLFYRQFSASSTRRAPRITALPSPNEQSIVSSAKLYALKARLRLPESFPLQTLARCLVHPTADPDSRFNNSALSLLGGDLLGYYTAEWLLCNFPRLPMTVLFAAQNGYVGPTTCAAIVKDWGVEAIAEPGGEVDPGFLQFRRKPPGASDRVDLEDVTKDNAYRRGMARGMGSRIVADDQFGDFGQLLNKPARFRRSAQQPVADEWEDSPMSIPNSDIETPSSGALSRGASGFEDSLVDPTMAPRSEASNLSTTDLETASTSFLRALTGALHLHTSPAYSSSFHESHILSRQFDLSKIFNFKSPTRDLSRLCAREGFEPPVARLLSETGRHSIAPVFVVGVYSGFDKLGEGAGNSLSEARSRASANALRGWYLYRPGEVVRPSEMQTDTRKKWVPNFVDCGEVVL